MRERVVLNFNLAGTDVDDAMFRDSTGIDELVHANPSPIGFYSVALAVDDPRLHRLREALIACGATTTERWERTFTPSEAAQAPAVWLGVGRAPRGEGGARHGTEFDLSDACMRCGAGIVQTSPLIVLKSELPRGAAQVWTTMGGEILLGPSAAQPWFGVDGLNLVEARLPDNKTTGWFQLIPTSSPMVPMAATTCGIRREGLCPICTRSGFFHAADVPVDLRFPAMSERQLDRVRPTWEWFGNGVLRDPFSSSSLPRPLIVLPRALMQSLVHDWPRGLIPTPLDLEADGQ